jgi:hypothetical protein
VLFLGLSTFGAWLVLPAIAAHRLPLVLFVAVFASGIWLYVRALTNIGLSEVNLLLFGTGVYMQSAALALAIGVVLGSIERILTAAALVLLFACATLKLLGRRRFGQGWTRQGPAP